MENNGTFVDAQFSRVHFYFHFFFLHFFFEEFFRRTSITSSIQKNWLRMWNWVAKNGMQLNQITILHSVERVRIL